MWEGMCAYGGSCVLNIRSLGSKNQIKSSGFVDSRSLMIVKRVISAKWGRRKLRLQKVRPEWAMRKERQ